MTYRIEPAIRTWLTNIEYDLLCRDTVLHYDIMAYVDILGGYWFAVEARAGGVGAKLAQELYRWAGEGLEAVHATPALTPVSWRADSHDIFTRAHGALLSRCQALPGYFKASRHCHYLKALDVDPWPRGTVNSFSYAKKVGGKEGALRQRTRAQRTGGLSLPDLL